MSAPGAGGGIAFGQDLDWALSNLDSSAILANPKHRAALAERMKTCYEHGVPVTGLTDRFTHVGKDAVRTLLHEAGVDTLIHTGRPSSPRPYTLRHLADQYESGLSVRHLADKFHTPYTVVHDDLKKAGVNFRPRQDKQLGMLTSNEVDAFDRALGHVVRRHRVAKGWTRKRFMAELGDDRRTGTLASHELGDRAMSVARLAQYALALGSMPGRLVDEAYELTLAHKLPAQRSLLEVNLNELAATTKNQLLPLRAWAVLRLEELPASARGRLLADDGVLESMAALCGVQSIEVVDLLGAALISTEVHDD